MAAFTIFRHFTTFTFIFLFFKPTLADPNSSFYFKGFNKDSNFESNLALFGDAKVVNGSSSSSLVQLTRSASLSAGRLMYKKPIKLVEGKPTKRVSFSTYFSFSMSPENSNGLAFVMVPIGFPLNLFDNSSFGEFGMNNSKIRAFAVEFDTYKDPKYGDLNENHVGIDIRSLESVRVSNMSSINLVLKSGKRLQCWIDYEASSKHLEVRLSKFGDKRPIDPLLTYPIVFSEIWKEDEVFVGLSSSNGDSSQTCIVYSWSFKLRHVLHWMHSQPLDPKAFVDKAKPLRVHQRSACVLRVLAALIFGTGCGALGALVVVFVWIIFGKKRPVAPEELAAVHPVDNEDKKINVVLDKAIKDGEKLRV